jgi:hypothetical protein
MTGTTAVFHLNIDKMEKEMAALWQNAPRHSSADCKGLKGKKKI